MDRPSKTIDPGSTDLTRRPRATPGQLRRELLPVCCTESYSRSVAPRATPGLLLRELLPVSCAESYSRSAAPLRTESYSRCRPDPKLTALVWRSTPCRLQLKSSCKHRAKQQRCSTGLRPRCARPLSVQARRP